MRNRTDRPFAPKTRIYAHDKTHHGVTTGSTRKCTMHGCTGLRVFVKWPDGHWTWPCSKGLLPYRQGYVIG